MKFTKMVSMITLGAFLAMAPMAFATSDNCSGPECSGTGNFNIDSKLFSADGDLHGDFGGNSVAFGGQGTIGKVESQGAGFIQNGVGRVALPAAGIAAGAHETGGSYAVRGYAESFSNTIASTHGGIKVSVDPAGDGWNWSWRTGLTPTASGVAAGTTNGFAAQGSFNGTMVLDHGITGGVATQGSIGGFVGAVGVASGPDDRSGCRQYDSYGKAGVNAGIDMIGTSFSKSYAFDGPGYVGLGNAVGASTDVYSYGIEDTRRNGEGIAKANIDGGWVADSDVKSGTIMTPGNFAVANGQYTGNGDLGCNYHGSSLGFTQVEKHTVAGMNGATYVSKGEMTVTSITGNGQTPR